MTPAMIVAYEKIQGPLSRVWRMASSGKPPSIDELRHPPGERAYWCAADAPDDHDDFRRRPVYRTGHVPADAQCEECGIDIRQLQATITAAVTSTREPDTEPRSASNRAPRQGSTP